MLSEAWAQTSSWDGLICKYNTQIYPKDKGISSSFSELETANHGSTAKHL